MAVLFEPCWSVADEVAGEVSDKAVVDGKIKVLDRQLKVVVGLVELVEEEEVRLGKDSNDTAWCEPLWVHSPHNAENAMTYPRELEVVEAYLLGWFWQS